VKTRFEVCPATDLASGERIIADLDGIEVGVFNIDGEYYALKNDCPHQRASLCEGSLTGLTTADAPGEFEYERDGEIVRCPWHGWEFDVTTGESVFNPHRVKAKTFETSVEESDDPDTVETSEPASAKAGRLDFSTGTTADGGDTEDKAGGRTTTEPGADHGVALAGDEPPVDTYSVGVENGVVVVHL
jgi:Ferredoxin subunits of nitrite reductase and ring-hydroxylating dioxygenases